MDIFARGDLPDGRVPVAANNGKALAVRRERDVCGEKLTRSVSEETGRRWPVWAPDGWLVLCRTHRNTRCDALRRAAAVLADRDTSDSSAEVMAARHWTKDDHLNDLAQLPRGHRSPPARHGCGVRAARPAGLTGRHGAAHRRAAGRGVLGGGVCGDG